MSIKYRFKRDAAINDSSKVFTVPDSEVWIITHVNVKTVATADAGTRQHRVIVRDTSDNVVVQIEAGAGFTQGQTQTVDFFPGAPDNTTEINDTLKTAMPVLVLLPGFDLVVEDGAAIQAAADDMIVAFTYSIRTP